MQRNDEFAELLNYYLNRLERNASWLADKVKVSPSTATRWANGETRPNSLAIVAQLIHVMEIDNEKERIAFYRAAGCDPPPTGKLEALPEFHPDLTGQAASARATVVESRVNEDEPTVGAIWQQRRTMVIVLFAFLLFAATPPACNTAYQLLWAPPATPTPALLGNANAAPVPQIFNFNGPVEQFINEVENLTIFAGDSPEEAARKRAERAALIAGEVRYYLASVDSRLGLINTVLVEDSFGQQVAQTRATVAPALQEIAAAGYQRLIGAEEVNSLRQQLNHYPLVAQPGTVLLQLAGEGVVDATTLRFFYDQLDEVTWATESLFSVLGERAEESDARWQEYYAKSVQVAVALVENRSAFAQVAGLQLVEALATSAPIGTEAPISFAHLAAAPLLTTESASRYLTKLANDAARLQRERQALLAEGDRLLEEDLKTYEALNQELVIQPDDSWERVVVKAISLRQLGRTAEAIAAFADYGNMFAPTDPTAERYAILARHFTMQMATLGVVDGAVYLFAVEEGSQAAEAGLRVEDIIIAVNEQPVRTVPDLQALLEAAPVGEPLTLTLLRLDESALLVHTTVTVVYENPLGIGYMPI